jgi:hypothetical protein
MKLKREFNETDNSTVYRRARWEYLVEAGKSKGNSCSICPPNRGCNGHRYGLDKSWKRFRKTQYKAVDIALQPIEQEFQDMFDDGVITRDLMEYLSACRPVDEVLEEFKNDKT